MQKRKLIPTLVVALALLCGIVIGAGASSTMQEIKAYLTPGIAIKYNGEEQIMKDAKGNRAYPISYNGGIYVPLRGVSDILGVDAKWDGPTQSVLLGKTAKGVDLIDTYKAYDFKGYKQSWPAQVQSADGKTADISGMPCSHWLAFDTDNSSATNGGVTASFNLLGKHDTLTFSYYSNNDAVLKVWGDDGFLLGEYTITGGAVAKTVTINLLKTSELKFEMATPSQHTNVRVFDAYLDAE